MHGFQDLDGEVGGGDMGVGGEFGDEKVAVLLRYIWYGYCAFAVYIRTTPSQSIFYSQPISIVINTGNLLYFYPSHLLS